MYKLYIKMCKNLLFYYFVAKFNVVDAARILAVFPSPFISHHIVFRVLTNELVRRGHEVVVITPEPAYSKGKSPLNLTEIDVRDISYQVVTKLFRDKTVKSEIGKETNLLVIRDDFERFFPIIEAQFKSEPVQELIKQNREFDLLLIEAFVRPDIVYSHVYKAPVVLVSTFGHILENFEAIGAPTHPILYPSTFGGRPHKLSVWNKIKEYYYYFKYKYLQYEDERHDDEVFQRMFGPNAPFLMELNKNIEMLLLNVHPIWMNNQPVPPGVIFMGGVHQKPVSELSEDLKSYLDSSKHGVIYVSFGTTVDSRRFPPKRVKVIIEALSELPYDILFKWDEGQLPGTSKNIRISKWFPQSDLLRHPQVKAFVMQGGLQSTDEAITGGVPLVCIPLIGDQWYNAAKSAQLGIGIKLDFLTLTTSELKSSIETVVSNTSYRDNIIKLRDRMHDQPQSPLERAVWWIEYVLRHGGARHLRAPAANMSWAEYYELELLLLTLLCVIVSFVVTFLLFIVLCRFSRKIKVKVL